MFDEPEFHEHISECFCIYSELDKFQQNDFWQKQK